MAPSRIDELRRRVHNDPASIAFAQLAEEYRRSGQTEEAVRVCREGLTRHPGYLSARVTLGRALLDLEQLAGARDELQFVVGEAPENLAAVRGLAEIYHREGNTAEALTYYQRALTLARHDPEIEEIVQQLSRQAGAATTDASDGLSFEEAHQELLSAAERLPLTPPQEAPLGRDTDQGSTAPFDFDRLVAALGSPTAPPQVEAAVEGRPSTVALDLPALDSLGLDPFAALEAELRANESESAAAKVAPWPSPFAEAGDLAEGDTDDAPAPGSTPAVAVLPSAEEVLADALLGDVHAAQSDAGAVVSTQASDAVIDPFATGDDQAVAPPLAVMELDEAEPMAGEPTPESATAPMLADSVVLDEPRPQLEVQTQVEVTPARLTASPAEGVLDELESWLTTLQDRASQ